MPPTRNERSNSLEPSPDPNPKQWCRRTLRLDLTEYVCKRTEGHGGAHDAFCRHGDGILVRW
jgi:hypothetical protein